MQAPAYSPGSGLPDACANSLRGAALSPVGARGKQLNGCPPTPAPTPKTPSNPILPDTGPAARPPFDSPLPPSVPECHPSTQPILEKGTFQIDSLTDQAHSMSSKPLTRPHRAFTSPGGPPTRYIPVRFTYRDTLPISHPETPNSWNAHPTRRMMDVEGLSDDTSRQPAAAAAAKPRIAPRRLLLKRSGWLELQPQRDVAQSDEPTPGVQDAQPNPQSRPQRRHSAAAESDANLGLLGEATIAAAASASHPGPIRAACATCRLPCRDTDGHAPALDGLAAAGDAQTESERRPSRNPAALVDNEENFTGPSNRPTAMLHHGRESLGRKKSKKTKKEKLGFFAKLFCCSAGGEAAVDPDNAPLTPPRRSRRQKPATTPQVPGPTDHSPSGPPPSHSSSSSRVQVPRPLGLPTHRELAGRLRGLTRSPASSSGSSQTSQQENHRSSRIPQQIRKAPQWEPLRRRFPEQEQPRDPLPPHLLVQSVVQMLAQGRAEESSESSEHLRGEGPLGGTREVAAAEHSDAREESSSEWRMDVLEDPGGTPRPRNFVSNVSSATGAVYARERQEWLRTYQGTLPGQPARSSRWELPAQDPQADSSDWRDIFRTTGVYTMDDIDRQNRLRDYGREARTKPGPIFRYKY